MLFDRLYERAALDFSNEIRGDAGLPPEPKLFAGRSHELECPIAKTVAPSTCRVKSQTGEGGRVEAFGRAYKMPFLVRRFVLTFDRRIRRYPHLRDARSMGWEKGAPIFARIEAPETDYLRWQQISAPPTGAPARVDEPALV